jgi:hypothetical protein
MHHAYGRRLRDDIPVKATPAYHPRHKADCFMTCTHITTTRRLFCLCFDCQTSLARRHTHLQVPEHWMHACLMSIGVRMQTYDTS